jgi:hypothetical protein
MDGRRYVVIAGIVGVAALARPTGVEAQPTAGRRVAFDTVVGMQDLYGESRDWPTALVFDPFISAEIRRHLEVSGRPKVWRLNGEWELALDQLSVQYGFRAGSNWRVEAGRFPSPMGLGMTENRPNVNPGVLWWHRPYYMPLPRLGPDVPMVSLVSATYPDGILLATSGDRWDARAAVVDRAPVQFWHDEVADEKVNTIVAGGISPRQGMRFGFGTAWGDLTDEPQGTYRMVNMEGDYSFGYTRISGETTRDWFVMPDGDYEAWGWTLQAQQTLTPRVFVHARTTTMNAPVPAPTGTSARATWRSLDTTVGYRVDPEVTVKLGYSAVATWGTSDVDHQIGVAVMWSRRWW